MDQIGCKCLPGFSPESPNNWHMRDSSGGCMRKNQESVFRNGKGFVKVADVKLPDTSVSSFDRNSNLRECESECLRNCSCTDYADADFTRGESGRLMWYGDLMDTREISGGGRDLHVRVDALVLGSEVGKELDGTTTDQELPLLDITTIKAATNNFASTNKLGQGGFGPVYKVWNLWKEGKSSDIVDSLMAEPYNSRQVSRSIQIGLVCVQERAPDRPTMMDIILMLGNEAALASPNKPAFILNGSGNILDLPLIAGASTNEITIIELDGR
ncbi:hypothetical protein NL676_007835 [Syzygium grande]|nr:hypothetical protein NL676_007835 [Syzygium grande]